jgi:peptidoglycan/xylan/chitin deacetylase (PgdA/CDA1 family)
MDGKDILVAYGVDIDAVGGWLGSYGGEDSPDDISRGVFAGEVGTPRIMELFRRYGIRQTFFWPGHSVETFGEQFGACVAAGHEIGVHGYSHENPIAMSRQQEIDVLDFCVDLLTRRSGPYYVRVGDSWTKIDYTRSAADWMKPLMRGGETDLIEIPANWYLDDLPPS